MYNRLAYVYNILALNVQDNIFTFCKHHLEGTSQKHMVWPPPRHIQYKRTSTILSFTTRSSYVQANYSKASPCAITWKILPLKAIFSGSSRQTKVDKALQTTHSHFVFQKPNSPQII